MKTMEFLTLLGELDETAAVPASQNKKRRPLWVAAAACFCACLLGFSAWFFLPPMKVIEQAQWLVVIRIDDRLVSYEIVKTNTMSRFERMLLPDEPGEVLCRHKDCTFYRVAGASDLVYLIMVDGNGKTSVLEYEDHIPTAGMDMTDSMLIENGWYTPEDIAALNAVANPTMGEILETIYGVTSAADIQSIRFRKYGGFEDAVSQRVRVKAVTVKDGETLERLYGLLAVMTPMTYGQELDTGGSNVRDEAYLNGEKPLAAQVNREIVVTLTGGHKLTFYYHPATGVLRQNRPAYYTVLSAADNGWLIDLAEIDMNWRDWGTEKAPNYSNEGCETATTPVIPDPEAP